MHSVAVRTFKQTIQDYLITLNVMIFDKTLLSICVICFSYVPCEAGKNSKLMHVCTRVSGFCCICSISPFWVKIKTGGFHVTVLISYEMKNTLNNFFIALRSG